MEPKFPCPSTSGYRMEKILCQSHHGVVNRRVAVRMVFRQHRTDGVNGFSVGFFQCQTVFTWYIKYGGELVSVRPGRPAARA